MAGCNARGIDSLSKNKTWILVKLPEGRKAIDCKWVSKIKYKTNGSVNRYKARLCARGFTQRYGIDYRETYSPVVRMDSVRTLLAIAAQFDLDILQIDVKTAFLHGLLEEEIFMSQPEGFAKGNYVCKLQKALYGLKQASRSWNQCFTKFLKQFDLVPLASDGCVFATRNCCLENCNANELLNICIYVDDGLLLSNSKSLMKRCVVHLEQRFEITTSEPDVFVGVQIKRDRANGVLQIHQQFYLEQVIARYNMSGCEAVSVPMQTNLRLCKTGVVGVESKQVDVPYRQAIGSLLYAALATRPDICYSVSLLARFSTAPRLTHLSAVKYIMRYLVNKLDFGITYKRRDKLDVCAYSDADLGGCNDTRKSTTGYLVLINGAPVIWKAWTWLIVCGLNPCCCV